MTIFNVLQCTGRQAFRVPFGLLYMHFCNSGGLLKTPLFPPCGPSILNSQGYRILAVSATIPGIYPTTHQHILYSFSSAPNPASLHRLILLLFSIFTLHLFIIFILLFSCIVSCFSSAPYPAPSRQHLILSLQHLSSLSLAPDSTSL